MLDFSVRGDLSRDEEFEIATILHTLVLDAIFRRSKWMAKDAVFHGGTALSIFRASKRFSEDLDFMISKEAADVLEKVILRARDDVRMTMTVHIPGSTIEVRGPKGAEVAKWNFVWSHPNRRNKVNVKAEFLTTAADVLKNYGSIYQVPTGASNIAVSTPIPAPTLVSAWADKIKAIATRDHMKWRDLFDLAFISQMMRRETISNSEKKAALQTTASIYGKTLDDVAAGLRAVQASGALENEAEFEADLGKWLDSETFKGYQERAMFGQMLKVVSREIKAALSLDDPDDDLLF